MLAVSCASSERRENNDTGTYNFTLSDFNDKKTYNLFGEWDFYWDTLLTPQQIKTTQLKPLKVYVPSRWTKYEIDGETPPYKGYATYQTKIVAPANEFYSIKIKRIFLASKIYIDDSLVLTTGKVATNKKDFRSDRATKEYVFFSPKDTITLTIQVSNFEHIKAGIIRPIKLGKPVAIIQYAYSYLLYDMTIIGALVFMMIFYLILFTYNPKNRSNLYFALFLIIEVLSISLDGELIFVRVFPNAGWPIAQKLLFLSITMRALMFVILIESLTKEYFSKKFKKFSIFFCLIVSTFVLVTPIEVYTRILIIIVSFTLVALVYELFVTWEAAKKDKNLMLSFIGLLMIFISAVNDSLHDFGIISTFYASGLGIFLFTLTQAILLSIKNATIMNKADNFSNREKIEGDLKKALLTTPSYDLPASLVAVINHLNVEKLVLISVDEEDPENKFTLYILAEKYEKPKLLNQKLDLNKDNEYIDINYFKKAIDTQSNLILSNKSDSIKSKNLIILPVVKEDQIITVLYLENKTTYLNKAQINIIESLKLQFNTLINTALIYYRLEQLNNILEQKVQERTSEVEMQKQEIDIKNQQLDEKVQLLEEQYAIQNEINNELQSQIEQLEIQNKNLEKQNIEINNQKETILRQNRQIESNTQYASTILSLLNIKENYVEQPFEDFFHLDLPRDIVSGDFYFSKKLDNCFIFALADCTGHGIPGALMNTFANRELNKIINKLVINKREIDPAAVLNQLRDQVKSGLETKDEDLKDGLDIALCVYYPKTRTLDFAGAYQALNYIRNGEIYTLKGNRMPIGSYVEGFEFPFTKQTIQLEKGDIVYLNTDGYVDQFNSELNEKFYTTNLKKLFVKIHEYPLNSQEDLLKQTFSKWKGSYYQLDDVSIIGAKI